MRKGLVFILGLVAGCLLTIAVLYVIALNSSESNSDITIAEREIPFDLSNRFEVFQVLSDGALAHCEDVEYSMSMFTGPIVYILAEGQNQFYNDQVVEIPRGKRAVQIGTFRYATRLGENVVPVIRIL